VSRVDLSKTSNRGYAPGRPFVTRALWLIVQGLVFLNPLVTSYRLKAALLRRFGAQVGERLVIKPGVHIKYPWHLSLGDHVWLGERCWIDNFVSVEIGTSVCLSQGSYLCTGNHDWRDPGMGLVVRPIKVEDGAWVGAFARIGPGVRVGPEAIITLGAVLSSDAEPAGIYRGNPAVLAGRRWPDEGSPTR
jgi:putative colanic acid biosynthesis acetyltransferase WcaF